MKILMVKSPHYHHGYNEGHGQGVLIEISATDWPTAGPDLIPGCRIGVVEGSGLVLDLPPGNTLGACVAHYERHGEWPEPGYVAGPTSIGSAVAHFRAHYTAQYGVPCPI